jgi:energy-coupling factor transporter ATP-binding protein EcfA2
MEFLGIELSGYRRFRDDVRMDLAPRLVCVVGPNAAGKSSFLDALMHLNHDDDFGDNEATRGGGEPHIEARFALEKADKDLLADIPEAKDVRQILVHKDPGDERYYSLEPDPERDLRNRKAVAGRLDRFHEHSWIEDATSSQAQQDPDAPRSPSATLEQARELLHRDAEFQDSDLELLRSLATFLRAVMNGEYLERAPDLPQRFHRLPNDLDRVVEEEQIDHPRDRAFEALRGQIPRFHKFDDGVRELHAPYDLNEAGDPALGNLLALAETSWEDVRAAAQSGDPAERTVWRERANAKLLERFTAAWRQGYSKLVVQFELSGMSLDILMKMQQTHDFIRIGEQSDGIRQFLALRAFMALHNEAIKPIVLIDEAETHLHYDAQADLMRVLEDQRDAAMVICTTHSAGCLPRDLGTGVRAIVPITVEQEVDGEKVRVQTDDSEVINSFWTEGRGFSPMLIAMGASAFAFSSTRRALVSEGMSDVVLLPTLLREATRQERLDYQVTPHFADAHPDEIPDFDLLASRVAYVADGDKGGRDHVKKLIKNRVRPEQIVYIGGSDHSELSMEDLITKKAYLRAVNRELEVWHDDLKFREDALPDSGRAAAVKKWAARRKGRDGEPIELSKVAIAQRVLDLRSEEAQLVRTDKREVLRELDREVRERLARPTVDLVSLG